MARTRKKRAEDEEDKSNQNKDKELPFKCTRGCNMVFQHKTSLYRRKKVCTGKSPLKKKDRYRKVGDQYQCLKCEKMFRYQPNVIRHSCKEKVIHQCQFCNKIFYHKSKLTRHEASHRKTYLSHHSLLLTHHPSQNQHPLSYHHLQKHNRRTTYTGI